MSLKYFDRTFSILNINTIAVYTTDGLDFKNRPKGKRAGYPHIGLKYKQPELQARYQRLLFCEILFRLEVQYILYKMTAAFSVMKIFWKGDSASAYWIVEENTISGE
jgi:hypothetical protein